MLPKLLGHNEIATRSTLFLYHLTLHFLRERSGERFYPTRPLWDSRRLRAHTMRFMI
jgi:hypothetical protein